MTSEDVETILWILGVIALIVGSGIACGWVASLITFGAIFAVWPLVKQFARR